MKAPTFLVLSFALVALAACTGEPVESATDRPAPTEKNAPADDGAKTTVVSLDIEGMS